MRADVSRANLDTATLIDADLSNANLTQTRLRSADLRNANVQRACCDGADFTNACLDQADLSLANFQDATLFGVDLRGANLNARMGRDGRASRRRCAARPAQCLLGAGAIHAAKAGVGCSLARLALPVVRAGSLEANASPG